jgi:hypothetical protein
VSDARLLAAAHSLRVDAVTAEVVRALDVADCPSLLLKGAALRDALYGDGALRTYGDSDLLVSPSDLARAAEVLRELGFALVLDHREHTNVAQPRAQEWLRAPNDHVDLHWQIAGVEAPASEAWDVLWARSVALEVGRAQVRVLDRVGIALMVALHAAHHGTTVAKPLADLERALDQISTADWQEAAALARALDATEAFGAGLRLVPAGAQLAHALGVGAGVSSVVSLMASSQPPGALGLLRALDARGARARTVREALFPSPAFMRATYPGARGGRGALVIAYANRLSARVRSLPRAVAAVRAARRARD